ncbi:acetoacetate--CoA ligase [Teichococcus oryzae]|uniref:Acetoacetate--CoA ligase n=1 Tax=Teichococcus oryzae TaxID=1608942 RepID=A0A5B2TE17_9PROT|nr:acetoacetate--CoA ligase [Pseudoroseomonas oryzae]KAA2212040.1 acetoacetate--CoA ligase [Pseudoroseomonas oryzae]
MDQVSAGIRQKASGKAFPRTPLAEFQSWCSRQLGRTFRDDDEFAEFAVAEPAFWALLVQWSGLPFGGALEPALEGHGVEGARFFPEARLNYAECLLAGGRLRHPDDPAIIACGPEGREETLSWRELARRVSESAAALEALGVRSGDRVATVLRNDASAVIACLATAAIGAAFSSCSPEMAPAAILSRFGGLEAVLLIGDGMRDGRRLAELASAMRPPLGLLLTDGDAPEGLDPAVPTRHLASVDAAADGGWARFPFDHPLFVMFSSGTTGAPKRIVHGAGGTMVEHFKEHRLHCSLGPADRLLFHTTCAWMMWNWQLSALACGTTLVLWDGPVEGPETLWHVAATQRATVFGTSPPYLRLCAERGYSPGRSLDLGALRAVLSTGSVLQDHQFDWVTQHVGDLPVQSISGGTDIIGCFMLGHPHRPVRRGEAQCSSLGLDVRALPFPDAAPGEPGELVCANPFPSRPVCFLGDTDGTRLRQAYFAQNPGYWTHGDLVTASPEGGWRLHGRSDGILNVNGIRIGPAEIYAALSAVPEVVDAMAVEQALPGGRSRIALLVVLRDDVALDDHLSLRIRREIGSRTSSAHVPAVVAGVTDLPTTHSGKRSERAAADTVSGRPVRNREALRNPEILNELSLHPLLDPAAPAPASIPLPASASRIERMTAAWRRAFGNAAIGPDDDFFHLGGDSLLAIPLMLEVEAEFGRLLPMSVLFGARTASELAAVLDEAGRGHSCLAPAAAGAGRPIFAFHGMSGTVVEQRSLIAAIAEETRRPVIAVQAAGLDPGTPPHNTVGDMAEFYARALIEAQPEGAYALCGYSFGGLVAAEVARVLSARGRSVEMLAVLDSGFHPGNLTAAAWLRYRLGRLGLYASTLWKEDNAGRRRFVAAEMANVVNRVRLAAGLSPSLIPGSADGAGVLPEPLNRVRAACERAYAAYRADPLPAGIPVTLFRAERDPRNYDPAQVWRRLVPSIQTIDMAERHHGLILGDAARRIAFELAVAIRRSARSEAVGGMRIGESAAI